MRIVTLDSDRSVFIVAEIGNNHEGDVLVAEEMIRQAADAGVDAVKFQTYQPEYLSGGDSKRLARLQRFCLSHVDLVQLANLADELNVTFFSTPFDVNSAKFLNSIQPIFKIASSDNNFFPLIDVVARFEKPMLVSTGIASDDLINATYNRIKTIWNKKDINPGLALLHCVSRYPTPPDKANLSVIATLKQRYPDLVVGYSDHTIGINAAVAAVALGARIVEKHFTLDKDSSDFRDHKLSADPNELKCMVEAIREIGPMIGTGELPLKDDELEASVALRRSAAAARSLDKGTVLTEKDMIWVRPGTGFVFNQLNCVLGKTLKKSISYAEVIMPSDLRD